MTDFVVAVDGPAGSGKSSVSKSVARLLGFAYLDTGAAYRAVTWHVLRCGADLSDEASIADTLATFEYSCATDPDSVSFVVDGVDVTEAIRESRVTSAVSSVAKVAAVRAHVNQIFRTTIATTPLPGIVVEGRDITTVVAPDANVRILLTATEEARAARRAAELAITSVDTPATVSGTAEAIKARDTADAKVSEFMSAAEGVTTVDSTDLTFDQTVDAVVRLVESTRQ